MEILDFLSSLKSRDAALVYFWLRNQTGGAGLLEATSLERIATGLNADKLATSRGAGFTAAVVRSKLKELETVGVVDRETLDGSTFNLYVYNPIPLPTVETVEEPAVDPYGGRRLFNFENENENEIQNENEKTLNKENILIINKKINNQAGDVEAKPPTPCGAGATSNAPTPEEATRRVDWNDEAVKKTRHEIASIVWEPEINPGIIDRLTAACVLGISGVDKRRALKIARNAVEERDRYLSSEGRAGKSRVWKALGYSVKRIYDSSGYAWTPTRPGMEPEPTRRRMIMNDENKQEEATAPERQYTQSDSEGFTIDDLGMDFRAFSTEVSKRLHTRPGFDTQARAQKIRAALRGLKLASELEAVPAS